MGEHILVEWETTGHAHRLDTGIVWWNTEWPTLLNKFEIGYVVVPEKWANLTHEEHNTIYLKEGVYWIGVQREYDPIEERRVLD